MMKTLRAFQSYLILILCSYLSGCNCSDPHHASKLPLESMSQVVQDSLPSDVPLTERNGRIMTGTRQNVPSSFIEYRTSLGIIVGLAEQSDRLTPSSVNSGRRFYAFRGIPYAKPPVGQLRWADPQILTDPWERGRLDATQFRPFCPQFDHDKKEVVGNEDCLFLNIFTPFLPGVDRKSPSLPVLVFIHGGAYTRGASSSHGPFRLMREDMVLVTLNYRLGVLGLLSTNDEELPGNYALLDQLAALQWVRRFVAEFGGDSNSVTLGGFSAGASYVHLHMMSPLSKGLFSKAILMSGSGNCLWSVQPDPVRIAETLAQDVDCPTSSSYEMKECLLLKDTATLLTAQAKRSRYVYWPFEYRPVVDAGLRASPFLRAPVSELMRGGPPASTVPVLMGGTPEEGILFALTVALFSKDASNPQEIMESSSSYLFRSVWPNASSADHVTEGLHSFYYSDYARTDLNTLVAEMTDALTDLLFTSCVWDAAAYFAKHQPSVHTYLMTHHDEGSPSFGAPLYRLAQSNGITSPLLRHGVSHGDDVILIFDFPYSLGNMSPRDLHMSLMLTSIVGSFLKVGNPQSRLISQSPPWEALRPGDPVYYYRLSLNPNMIEKPFRHKERNLWMQTLPQMERTFEIFEESWNWQIGFWVVFSLFLLMVIIVIAIGIAILRSRHSRKYPEGGATLRSQKARPTSTLTDS